MSTNKLHTQLRKWSELLILFAVIGVCAWLTQKYHYVFDWTRDNRNTLTETSRTVLQHVDDTLLMTALARNAASERQAIQRKIDKYLKFKPEIDVKFLDIDTEIELAKELHLK